MSRSGYKIRIRSFLLVMLFVISGLASIMQASTTVATWQGDKKGAVSITFDDGLTYHFEVAWPMLQQRNLKATFYIISDKLDLEWFLPYIDIIVADNQEIGSHSASHLDLTTLSEPNLVEQLQGSQIALQNYTDQDVTNIAYPFGAYNPDIVAHTKDYYVAGRGVGSWYNEETGAISLNGQSPNLYELLVISPHDNGAGDANAIAHLKYAVDRAVADNKWAIEMFHGIDGGYDAVSSQVLSIHLDYLVANEPNVWTAPVGTISEYIYERDANSITTLIEESDLIQLDLQCDLDPNIFNTPLTLLTLCPVGWESLDIQVQQDDDIQIADIVFKEGSFYIMYNALPNAGIIEIMPTQAVHTITASVGTHGQIDPSGEVVVEDNSNYLFTAIPDTGYEVDEWLVDETAVQMGGTQFELSTITADHTVAVTFTPRTYTLTVSAGPNGSIDPSGEIPKAYGSTQMFTASPDTGYTVDRWMIDGISVQEGGRTYEHSIIAADQSVHVAFRQYSATVALWQGDKNGAVSISFNNGWDSQYQNAFPALQSRDLKATFYTISSQISFPNIIQIQQLVADGQEIGSQAVDPNDLTELPYEQQLYQLSESQAYLQQLTGQEVTTLAYPYGTYDAGVISLAKNYYIAARTTDALELNDPNDSFDSDWFYELVVIGPHDNGGGDANAIAYLNDSVDLAASENKWAIELFHSIGISGGYDAVSNEAFGEHLDYLLTCEPNVWVAPVGRVSEYIYERNTAVITTLVSDGNMIRFDLQCGLDGLFNTPLTLLTECPPEWESSTVYVQQGAAEQIADIVTRNNALYLMYSAMPDAGPIELVPRYTISGYCLETDGLTPLEGVLLQTDTGVSTLCGSDGFYEIWVDHGWTGTITPEKTGYAFTPDNDEYINVTQNYINADYSAELNTYTIYGYVRNILGTPVESVSVVANNGGGTDTTDGAGYYEVGVTYGWSGNVQSAKADYTFEPAPAVYSNVIGDQAGDFTAQLDSDIDGSGDVGQPDLLILCENWLSPGDLSTGDLDGSGTINLPDFAEFANVWLME
ncbi:MAG: polysaccharide deacetylase family protein [Planctomycetota bacterium]